MAERVPASMRPDGLLSEAGLHLGDFEVQPLKSPEPARSVTLTPLRLISRTALRISWLDRLSAAFRSSRGGPDLFSASDPALNAALAPETGFPQVLVAREKVSGSLCAIERAGKGQYALCGIGPWVREEKLQITVASRYARPFTARCTNPSANWRSYATLPDDGNAPGRSAKRIKLSMQRPSSIVPTAQNDAQVQSQPPAKPNDPPPPIEAPNPPAMTKDQLFETLVCQYLEALYLSRTSLAFFAKGPLSRTRIAFASPTSALSLLDLTNFLKTMILGYYGAIDKKFEKHLPALVAELALQLSESDVSKEKGRKRRPKKKKLKLGKEGTYPFEVDYIKKWWKGDEDAPVQANESPKQRLSRRIGDLRTREALLQVILILEVLALEASLGSSQPESQLGTVDNDAGASQGPEKSKSNAKKPPDINTILDILADRLLIWQDIDLDLGLRADRSPARPTPGKDKLGGFCFEVLIPLYKSRLPKRVARLCKNFAGAAGSPEKRPNDQSAPTDKPAKKPRRTLQKTSSTSTHNAKPRPPLSRAATDTSSLSQTKRQPSETPSLHAIPLFATSQPAAPARHARRPSSSLKHLAARQVSLKAMGATTGGGAGGSEASKGLPPRKRKMGGGAAAADDTELRSAIASIMRPDRRGAGRAAADEREKRRAEAAAKSKSGGGGGRRAALASAAPNVQVLATPHAKRRRGGPASVRGASASARGVGRRGPAEEEDEDEDEPELDLVPPSSAVHSTPAVAFALNVAETPSRAPAVRASPDRVPPSSGGAAGEDAASVGPRPLPSILRGGNQRPAAPRFTLTEPDALPSTPCKGPTGAGGGGTPMRPPPTSAVEATPCRPAGGLRASLARASGEDEAEDVAAVTGTPVAPPAAKHAAVVPATPVKRVGGSASIYDALGWNDYGVDD